ncbi:hypothetical protein [Endobacterium cereale]|uniref:hypothetical protein n=1 Tax=Endobacterium cereale TaxID=2663029 RepID=UPI002B46780F|nr:hypothetical protein [Endobacterium cereale]MEB2848027.1 hypothetical protein [Endobacterium cereale]
MEELNEHPEQDPAEGSREIIERDLARGGRDGRGKRGSEGTATDQDSDASRSDADTADQNRDALVVGAKADIENANGDLPKDQI